VHSFVSHVEDQGSLEIFTSSTDDVGSYNVLITSTIQVPTDYTLTSFDEVVASVQLSIEVIDECSSTVIDDFTLIDMITDKANDQVQ
jgi:hypothetical protein